MQKARPRAKPLDLLRSERLPALARQVTAPDVTGAPVWSTTPANTLKSLPARGFLGAVVTPSMKSRVGGGGGGG
jgi:hypothetical protein